MLQRAFHKYRQPFFEQLPAAGEPLSDRLRRHAKQLGHVLDGLALPIEEDQRLAVAFRDLLQGAPKNGLFLAADRPLHRNGVGRRGLGQEFQRCGPLGRIALPPAESAGHDTSRDPAQPGGQSLGLAQGPQVLPSHDEGFLGEILALAEAAGRAVGEGSHECLIARHDLPQGLAVAVQAGGHETGVIAVHALRRFIGSSAVHAYIWLELSGV